MRAVAVISIVKIHDYPFSQHKTDHLLCSIPPPSTRQTTFFAPSLPMPLLYRPLAPILAIFSIIPPRPTIPLAGVLFPPPPGCGSAEYLVGAFSMLIGRAGFGRFPFMLARAPWTFDGLAA
jgi:hypothetical protein